MTGKAHVDLRTEDFDYSLPEELIAQDPAKRRDGSRLMIVERAGRTIRHACFADLPRLVLPTDVLVANRSRVLPARLRARKRTGGAIELLLLREVESQRWTALARPSRGLRPGLQLTVDGSVLVIQVCEPRGDGEWLLAFEGPNLREELRRIGRVPLPPYIRSTHAPAERYQTVYADREGSVAAPTAGLHFSEELLARLRAAGVQTEFLTLHVGPGTFRPVTTERVRDHRMHAEWGELPADVAARLNRTRDAGGRLIAVGTTTTRLLESAVENGRISAFRGDTDRFIYPGYAFSAVDALITNFHLPRSSLLMLVSAFAGREFVLRAYEEAIHRRYRFFSYGDAMLIL